MDGQTIGDLAVRSSTGVSIARLLRDEAFEAGPGPDARLVAGDLVAVVGDQAQIARFESAAETAAGDHGIPAPPKGLGLGGIGK
jgi:K+/H+ antiporter YhaU regulatory subunit KhtT